MSVDGTPGSGPRGELSPEERARLEQRSGELGRKLEAARQTGHGAARRPASGKAEGMGTAMRLSSELVAGIVVGGALGWYLDSWFGTKPWLFIVFFLLGSASGMRGIVRAAMQQRTPPLPSVKDDGDEEK